MILNIVIIIKQWLYSWTETDLREKCLEGERLANCLLVKTTTSCYFNHTEKWWAESLVEKAARENSVENTDSQIDCISLNKLDWVFP